VPLGEDAEAYVLEVLDGAGVVRRADLASSTYRYTAADRIADFGTPLPATLHVRVAQASLIYGSGPYAEKIFNV
jgi:hypothetical protein